MATVKPQAISGVSSEAESIIMVVWPSIACTALGRLLGSICDSIPLKIGGIKLSYILFALPLASVASLLYFILKLFGERYVLTSHAVQKWSSIGVQMTGEVPLTDIAELLIEQRAGQAFYHAADLQLLSSSGDRLLRLEGVPRPEVFRQTIIEARDARLQVQSALDAIASRGEG